MYESLGSRAPGAAVPSPSWPRRLVEARISLTVVLLGFTSFFTDIATEMVNAILPLYLVLQLGFAPLAFGLFDGLYQGATALVRLAGGLIADRRQRYKEVAGAGYGLSAMCKLGLWWAGPAWVPTLGFLFLDRIGKGVRTAPRDALIALSSAPARLGEAFGVHRALHTAGALLGPLAAFALLALVPGGYDVIFVVSFCFGAMGLGILVLFVSNAGVGAEATGRASPRAAAALLVRPDVRGVIVAGATLSLGTVGDNLLYLTLQRRTALGPQYFPLLFLGTALTYLLLAIPAGRLADRVGRRLLFVAGHALLDGLYGIRLLRAEPGWTGPIGCLVLLGAYCACTDGVLIAIASSRLPAGLITSGLALVTTVTALGRLVASSLYGALWTWWGVEATLALFRCGLLAAVPAARYALGSTPVGAEA